ncbi:unnamed protein product [Effrenium voratum]|nr:unnamed protein product [Effrenium voratum]
MKALLLSCAAAAPVKKWQILGPFVVGKNELDGELPSSNATELLPGGGPAKARRFAADASSAVTVSWPEVDWQSLVGTLGGHEVLEWQARALGAFKASGELTVGCWGVTSFSIGNRSFVGDLYRAGLPPHPVELPEGGHRISLRLRGKLQAQFACEVERGTEPLRLFGDSFLAVPDFVEGFGLAGELLAVGLANQDAERWLTGLRPLLTGGSLHPAQPPLPSLGPGQRLRLPLRLEHAECGKPLKVAFEGRLGGEVVTSSPLTLRVKCRTARQSFVFTFEDPDGSVQHAAAVMPEVGTCEGGCPVVISLSGTSISARDSADAYKVGEKEGYRFGVRGAWLLAPTRHGAHNWEGPGLATAVAARRALPRLQLASRVPVGAGSLVAGHSMGGHGAWLLACALDDVLGVVSSASWLRKDQYADSNKVLLHDVASPHVEPALAALLKQAEAPFDAEALAPSLADLPVLIRVGSRDRTVHPWFSRRMYRTLLAAGASPSNVTLTEIEGKEHWWWDSEVSNDGGAVNDVQIRRFFEERLSSSPPPPTRWRLRTFNIAYSGAKHGLRILQMGRVDRLSEVSVEMLPGGAVSLRTTNVRSLRWGRAEAVELDGQQMVHGEATWCLSEGTWHSCAAPKPAGPMGRVFSRKLCGLADEEGEAALQYVANLLLMTGHGSLVLLRLEDVGVEGHLRAPEACENLLLVGTPQSNPAIAAVLKGPLRVEPGSLSLGSCSWDGHLGALALQPYESSAGGLALVATGTSPWAAAEALTLLATPTIPPMARQPLTHLLPDYVVLDVEETRRLGAGGFRAAGFWSHDWQQLPSAWQRCSPARAPAPRTEL